MKVIDLKEQKEKNMCFGPVCLVLGNFDGVHKGHSALIEKAVEEGKRCGISVGVWTFERHPLETLEGRKVPVLTTNEEKNRIFSRLGVDFVIYEDFTRVKDMDCQTFVSKVLVDELDCRIALCGFNFRFGKNGEGNAEFLKSCIEQLGRRVIIKESVCQNGITVSSSLIRRLTEEGDTEKVAELLGRPYSLTSEVIHGKKLGREIGFPTANQRFPENKIKLKNGIYACICNVDGEEYMGVANIGSRPTVNDNAEDINCETHIIGYSGILYGKRLETSFLKRIRDEKRFCNKDELKKAVDDDIKSAVDYFSKRREGTTKQ